MMSIVGSKLHQHLLIQTLRVRAFALETWKAVAVASEWPPGERGVLMMWLVGGERGANLSPTEQEVVDMQNEMEKKGRIFFPDFCKLCLRKFREFDDEDFKQELFKVECPDLQLI